MNVRESQAKIEELRKLVRETNCRLLESQARLRSLQQADRAFEPQSRDQVRLENSRPDWTER
jgi:hypothetical protein